MAKSSSLSPAGKSAMNTAAAGRIMSSAAKAGNGQVKAGSFPARAQKAAAQNANASSTSRKS